MSSKGYVLIICLIFSLITLSHEESDKRLQLVSSLFTRDEQYHNFNNAHKILPVSALTASLKHQYSVR